MAHHEDFEARFDRLPEGFKAGFNKYEKFALDRSTAKHDSNMGVLILDILMTVINDINSGELSPDARIEDYMAPFIIKEVEEKYVEAIAEAAIRKDGVVHTGKRHDLILNAAVPFGSLKRGEQGFVTLAGDFVTREEAALIAYKAGQIPEPKEKLYSEDL